MTTKINSNQSNPSSTPIYPPNLKNNISSLVENKLKNSVQNSENLSLILKLLCLEQIDLNETENEIEKPSVLSNLKENKELDKNFNFNQAQETLLKTLFKKWHLDDEICLIDLLLLELNENCLNLLKQWNIPDNNWMTDFHLQSLCSYLLLLRDAPQNPYGSLTEESEIYFSTYKKIQTAFIKFMATFKTSVSVIADLNLRGAKPTTINNLKARMDEGMRRCTETLSILLRFLNDQNARQFLLAHNLTSFVGAECLNHFSKIDISKTIAALTQYAHFIKSFLQIGIDKNIIGFGGLSETISKIEFLIQELKNKKNENYDAFQKEISDFTAFLEKCLKSANAMFVAASEGKYTHEDWLKTQKVKKAREKSQVEFLEMLHQNHAVLSLTLEFLKDIKRIVDSKIISISKGINYDENRVKARLLIVFKLFYEISSSEECSQDSYSAFRIVLRKELNKIFGPLHDSFCKEHQEFANSYNVVFKPEESDEHVAEKYLSKEFLKKFNDQFQECTVILANLSNDRQVFLSHLEDSLKNLPPELRSVAALQEISLDECMKYLLLVIILKDAETLFSPNTDSLKTLTTIPQPLLNLIQLKGINHLIDRINLSEIAAKEQEETKSEVVAETTAKESKETEEEDPLDVPSMTSQLEKPEKQEKSLQPELQKPLITLDTPNTRKVLKLLTEWGFVPVRGRGHGSHTILKQLEGGLPVVVPTSKKELKKGTLQSIEAQARRALAKPGN